MGTMTGAVSRSTCELVGRFIDKTNMDIEKVLAGEGFTKYRHEPTGFEAWSKSDLCTVDTGCKDWFLA